MIYSTKATVADYAFSKDRESYRITLRAKDWDGAFLPGQFLNIRLPLQSQRHKYRTYTDEKEFFSVPHKAVKRFPYIRRPFSIYKTEKNAKTGETDIHLLVAKLGIGSSQLADLPLGEEVEVFTPIGNSFPQFDNVKEVYLVGGGIGLAPLIETSRAYRKRGIKTSIFYGVRTSDASVITSKADIGDAADEFFIATDIKEDGVYNGFVTDLLVKEKLSGKDFNPAEKVVLACGPTPMFHSLAKILSQYNLEGYLSLENYMACGIGSCMGCVVKTFEGENSHNTRTCQEGPIFHYRDIYQ